MIGVLIEMIKLIQFFKGYVIIKVSGYSPERFMNLCCNHDILLWDIQNCGEYYQMCISIHGYFKLKAIAKKTKTKVVIDKKCGLPFFVPKIKKRSIFAIGFLLCFLFLMLMTRFVWSIEIVGNQTITQDMFFDFLEENNIGYGTAKNEIQMEELERLIRERYEVVTWTSGKIEGTKLTIQLKENNYLNVNIEENSSNGMDLVAEKEGTIVSIITRSGVPKVSIGDPVIKDQILVSGKIPIYAEDATIRENKLCNADADIYLQCNYMLTEKLPFNYQQKKYTGKEKKTMLFQIFEKEFQLDFSSKKMLKKDTYIEKKQFQILPNFYLPVYYGTIYTREYLLIDKKYNPDEAKQILEKKFKKNIQSLQEKGVQILEKDVKIEKDSKEYILKANISAIEKTGIFVPTKEEPLEVQEEVEVNE